MERVREEVEVIGDERDAMSVTAAGITMIGLLAGLMAFFITFAPAS
jgi:hypothetical protein